MITHVDDAHGASGRLASAWAVVIDRLFPPEQCAAWVSGVYAAREAWTQDFGGEQFTLGRAFYTHYEEGKSSAYFDAPSASDLRVEAHVPGLQDGMRALLAQVTGGRVVPRRGWCGPGVHVFPPGGPVAARGGVRHFDTEGLPAHHRRERRPAVTLVAMLQTTETEGGLEVWDVRYRGHDHPTREELRAKKAVVVYRPGDVVLIDSYRLHQIQRFEGERERISATVHGAETMPGVWEAWF